MSNIKKVFTADFMDTPCGHAHKTFSAAESCAKRTLEAAKKGKSLPVYVPHPDLVKEWAEKGDEPAEFVKQHLYS